MLHKKKKSMQQIEKERERIRKRNNLENLKNTRRHKPQKLPDCRAHLAPAIEVRQRQYRWKRQRGKKAKQSKAVKDTR